MLNLAGRPTEVKNQPSTRLCAQGLLYCSQQRRLSPPNAHHQNGHKRETAANHENDPQLYSTKEQARTSPKQNKNKTKKQFQKTKPIDKFS